MEIGGLYRVTLGVANLSWVGFNLDVTLSAQLCLGQWELGRIGWVAKYADGKSKSKQTQPRFPTRSARYKALFNLG